jgi:hypothetical protein
MVRGLILVAVVGIGPWLALSAGAFYTQMDSVLRLTLLVLYGLANAVVLVLGLIRPYMQMRSWLPGMSRREAALSIGQHYPEIGDKLLNAIDLEESKQDGYSRDLVKASIEQRFDWMRPFSFTAVVSWKRLRPYGLMLLPFVCSLLLIWFWVPGMLSEGSRRMIRYNEHYVLPAPFVFDAAQTATRLEAGSDWDIKLTVKGGQLPLEANLHIGGKAYPMRRSGPGHFVFEYPNLRKGGEFYFSASGYDSRLFEVEVYHRPTLVQLELWLDYPSYTGRPTEKVTNSGDLQIPRGTALRFAIQSRYCDGLSLLPAVGPMLKASNTPLSATISPGSDDQTAAYSLRWTPIQSGPYRLLLRNREIGRPDTLAFGVELIEDGPPGIEVDRIEAEGLGIKSEQVAALQGNAALYSGRVWDDYGIGKVSLVYSVKGQGQNEFESTEHYRHLSSEGGRSEKNFDCLVDPEDLGLKSGEGLRYCFEVEDNNSLQGPQRTRTPYFEIQTLSESEKEKAMEALGREAATGMEAAQKDLQRAENQTEKLSQKLKQQKEMGWEDRKALEELLKQQQETAEEIKEIQNQLELQQQNNNISQQKEILDKQQQIQEMADRLLNEEMKEMLRNIEKMLQENTDKSEVQKELEKLQNNQEKVAQELDRMLQFFKELEVEDRIERAGRKLDDLAQKQEDLAKDTKANKDLDQAAAEQERLRKEMDEFMKDLKEIQNKNKELDRPKDLEGLKEIGEEVQKDQQEASDEAKEGKSRSKTAQKQQKAASGMQKMSAQMKEQLAAQEAEELEEDLKAMRRLLGQVLKFSFDQEKLMDRLKDQSGYSQAFVQISRDQFRLRDQYDLIKDSLQALSKRVLQIQAPIQKEMSELESQFKSGLDKLTARDIAGAKVKQQYTMTAANNLANLLSELLQQATEQMANKMPGNQQCKKPKAGGSGMARLRSMQKKLSDQMQEQMGKNKGPKPGDQKGGTKPQRGEGGKEFAQMVAQQEAIRREMEKILKEINKDGKGGMGGKAMQEAIQQMEQTEKELVHKQLTQEALQRQQQILSRMLEAEKAEQEREMEQSRASESAKAREQKPRNAALEELLRQKRKEQATYKPLGPELNSYYKERNMRYQQNLLRIQGSK